jgi:hypothetical protein
MAQQVWVTSSLGGYLANPWLSAQLRHRAQPIMKFVNGRTIMVTL